MASGTSSLVDEIRARKDREDEQRDFRAMKRSASRRSKPTDEERERAEAERQAYLEGRREGTASAKKRTTVRAGANGKGSTSKRRSSPPRARRRPPRARAAGRQVMAPARSQIRSGMQTLGLTLGLVVLYVVLENADTTAGLVGRVGSLFEWLRSPHKTIAPGPN